MNQFLPMEPISKETVHEGKDWIHQVKWDGIRGLCHLIHDQVRVFTKNGHERTAFYPELMLLNKLVDTNQNPDALTLLDGEIVVLDEALRPSFSDLLIRERVRKESSVNYYVNKYPVKYILFDMPFYNGTDLRQNPLSERKSLVAKVLQRTTDITISDDFEDGVALLNLMKEKHYEGIVSKNNQSPYIGGKKHSYWYKTKLNKQILAIVCGVQYKNNFPNALLLGIYKDERYIYVGHAATGLKSEDFALIHSHLKSLKTDMSPFGMDTLKEMPKNNTTSGDSVIWLIPILTCQVKFMEWTNNGSLRHPVITGFSDKPPKAADGKEFYHGNI